MGPGEPVLAHAAVAGDTVHARRPLGARVARALIDVYRAVLAWKRYKINIEELTKFDSIKNLLNKMINRSLKKNIVIEVFFLQIILRLIFTLLHFTFTSKKKICNQRQ